MSVSKGAPSTRSSTQQEAACLHACSMLHMAAAILASVLERLTEKVRCSSSTMAPSPDLLGRGLKGKARTGYALAPVGGCTRCTTYCLACTGSLKPQLRQVS